MLEKQFKEEIARIKEKVYQRVTLVADHSNLINDLGLRASEKQLIKENLENPKGLCNASVNILQNKMRDTEKWNRRAEKLSKLIDFSIEHNHSLKDLKKGSHDLHKREKKTVLYEYILNKIDPDNPPKDIKPLLIEAKFELMESEGQSKINESNINALGQFKCDNLPPYLIDKEKDTCIKVSFATKALAAIKLFSFQNVLTCVAFLGANQIFVKIAGFAIDKVLSILLNVVGLFAYGIIKIVYYAVKIIFYLYEAHSEKDKRKKSQNFGDAVGTAIKIILTIIQVSRRRFK